MKKYLFLISILLLAGCGRDFEEVEKMKDKVCTEDEIAVVQNTGFSYNIYCYPKQQKFLNCMEAASKFYQQNLNGHFNDWETSEIQSILIECKRGRFAY